MRFTEGGLPAALSLLFKLFQFPFGPLQPSLLQSNIHIGTLSGVLMTTRERLDHTVTLVSGMIIGATIMYVFDENRGAKRRAQARDKVVHAGHLLSRGIRKRGRDLMNRAFGSVAELRSSVRDRARNVSDDQLVDRVRSQLGHVVSHSGLLRVEVRDGCVTVGGPVLEREVEKIRNRMTKIRGVKECRLEVEPHADLERASGRQASQPRQPAI